MAEPSVRYVTTEPPDNTQHPVMYERTVYIQGGIVALCVLGIVGLVIVAPEKAEIGVAVLGTIAGILANSLAQLLAPKG